MNLIDRLSEEINKRQRRIVVIGDAITDCWVNGRVEDCQDGCPKFVQESVITAPGGASNAIHCLDHWRVDTDLFSFREEDRPIKTRFVADGKIFFRWDDEVRTLAVHHQKYQWCYDLALEMVGCAAGVLLSDYDKRFLMPRFIKQVVDVCKVQGIPCVADCKRNPEVYAGAIFKGNWNWLEKYNNGANWVDRNTNWVVTRGDLSPIVNGCHSATTLREVECANHVGAGDCFAAHLTLALAYGFSLQDAAAIAHSAGRVYVQHPYNRAPWPQEVREDMGIVEAVQNAPG